MRNGAFATPMPFVDRRIAPRGVACSVVATGVRP